jgi:hypothetical protein
MCDGDYIKALDVADTYEKEFKRAKSSVRAQYNWLEHERETVFGNLMIGCAERMNGNYEAASVRFQSALSELTEIRMRNARLYRQAIATQEQAEARGTYANLLALAAEVEKQANLGGVFPDAKAAAAAEFKKEMQKLVQHLSTKAAQAAGARGDAALQAIRSSNSLLMGTYDAIGTLALDEALPLTRRSLKALRNAQTALGKSQEVREDRRFGYDEEWTISTYGDEHTSFLINYGNLFLKRAELKSMYPDLPPAEETVDVLLSRATDYLSEAEDRFSAVDPAIEEFYSKVTTAGDVQKFKDLWIKTLQEQGQGAGDNKSDLRARVDHDCLGVQVYLLGQADLNFKQSELAVIKLLHEAGGGGINNAQLEVFDEAEQQLLDARDSLRLITDHEDHPFLVICEAKLASLEAIRGWMQGKKPQQAYLDYIEDAQELMKKKKLSAETVQGVYLHEAKECWRIAAPRNQAEARISASLMGQTGKNFVFSQSSLMDLKAAVQRMFGIQFDFDAQALQGIDLNEPSITEEKLVGVRLRYALRQILDAKGLTYVIENGAVKVTNKQTAAEWMP